MLSGDGAFCSCWGLGCQAQVKGGGKARGSCLQLGQLPRKGQAAEGLGEDFKNSQFQQTGLKTQGAECSCSTWVAGKGSASFPFLCSPACKALPKGEKVQDATPAQMIIS